MYRSLRLFILLILPLSVAATSPQKNIVDYFLMLPAEALADTSVFHDAPDSFFTTAKRQAWVDRYAQGDNRPKPREEGDLIYFGESSFAIDTIDSARPYLRVVTRPNFYTADITYWKEKSGTVLIGIIVMAENAALIITHEVRFYRYDGHTLTKAENLIPRIPISAFVSPDDLQKDSIPADLFAPTLLYGLPEHGGGIVCRPDMAFWHYSDTIYAQELPFINLTDSQVHNARLRLSDDGFKLVPLPAHPAPIITDYFLLLPDTAFAGTHAWYNIQDSFLTIPKRKIWLDSYANNDRDAMNDSMYSDYLQSVYYCVVETIDTFYGYMMIKEMGTQNTPTALITYWKEKSGTVLIGMGLSMGLEYGSYDEVRLYRYDGHVLRNADYMIPRLTVSAFISAENLKKDGIPPDTYLDVHFTLPTEGRDISCFIDPEYDIYGKGPTVYIDPLLKHLKEEHIHPATLRLGDKGFYLVKK